MASSGGFKNLVDMFTQSTDKFRSNRLFGVKRHGRYEWLTYGDVREMVDSFRAGLASLGVGEGDKVAVIANNRPEWAVGAYATYGRGAQYVPMYEAQLEKDWKYIIEDCGAKVLLVASDAIYAKTKGYVDEFESLEHVVNFEGPEDDAKSFKGLMKAGKDSPVDPADPDPDDISVFIYTSGTTGKPKGVLLSHGNIIHNINALHDVFPMDQTDVSLSFLPWAHSFGHTCELHTLLSYGAALGLAESVQSIVENLGEVRPTLLFSVPRIFNRIYDGVHKKMAEEGGLKKTLFDRTLEVANKRRALSEQGRSSFLLDLQFKVLDKLVGQKIRDRFGGRLRYAFSGGAALAKEVAIFVDNLGIQVYEGYGLTETAPILTCNRPGYVKIGSVGTPLPGVEIVIKDIDNAPEGEGEICARGDNIMKGYHNLPEATADVLEDDGTFHTGDMGKVDDEGFLFITGRVKEQYKLENGKYVSPAPLEEKLKLSPYIANVMIDGTNKPYNIAVIVPDFESLKSWAKDKGLSGSDEELAGKAEVYDLIMGQIEEYSKDFKGYEKPRKVLLIGEDFTTDNDMLTPSLKVKRRNVIAKYGEQMDELYEKKSA